MHVINTVNTFLPKSERTLWNNTLNTGYRTPLPSHSLISIFTSTNHDFAATLQLKCRPQAFFFFFNCKKTCCLKSGNLGLKVKNWNLPIQYTALHLLLWLQYVTLYLIKTNDNKYAKRRHFYFYLEEIKHKTVAFSSREKRTKVN